MEEDGNIIIPLKPGSLNKIPLIKNISTLWLGILKDYKMEKLIKKNI